MTHAGGGAPVEQASALPYIHPMTERFEIVDHGDSLAMLLPAEVAERLGAAADGSLSASGDADGIHIRADAELASWHAASRRIMDEDAEALAELAR